ncbi:transcriptional regulator [Gordonia sp. MP11Mi]|uniref:4Fe-4S Wbl-type domain-containing protein n=1 Tax=Gordonia sp. MP11Mi TaxID=3022769 RepID=A0AA97GU03_9ACTN
MRGRDYDPGGCERLLARMLWESPKLTGAACTRDPRLFDSRDPDESVDAAADRHEQAVALCWQCPALTACREYADSLSSYRRVDGVIAARAPARMQTAGRPRKKAS